MKISGKVRKIILVIMGLVFLFSVGRLLFLFLEQMREEQAFENLSQRISGEEEPDPKLNIPAGDMQTQTSIAEEETVSAGMLQKDVKTPPPQVDAMEKDAGTGILLPYLELHNENQDFFGWIKIPDTKIDYPVMFTPEDPEYYIHRDFDGEDSKSGTPFLDATYTEAGNLYIVYGHHMKNRTMFGSLPYYEKKEYYQQYPYILFDTLYEQGVYEIASVFYSKIYRDEEKGFRYYLYKDLQDQATFDEFKQGIQKSALYDTGVELNYGDSVLLLSTCSYHTDEGRFVVVARKMENEVKQQ